MIRYSVWLGCHADVWRHRGYRVRGEWVYTTSLRDARRVVRVSIGAYASTQVPDGVYCYRDRAAMAADDSGTGAVAVISRCAQDGAP